MDKTIIQDYGKYLSKVNPEKGRRRAQEQEAKWAEERKKREEEKLTEAYQRELRERAEQAARERRKVEKATAAFNAEQAQKGTVSNTPDRRELRNRYNTRQNIAAHATGDMGVARPQDDIVAQMDSYINAGKLSKEQLKQAKELLKQEQKRSTDVIRQGNTDLMIPGTDEYNRYQKWLQLEAKTRGGATRGALLPFLKAGNAVTKGIERVTNSQNSPIAKEINRQFDSAFRQDDLAAEQSPLAHGAGNLAGSAAMYSATSPMFDAAAEGLGVSSTLGKILVNQAAQNAQDVALDTLPEVQRMRDRGMSDDEIRRATAKNVLGNMAGNAVMQGLSDAVIPALRNAFDKTPRIDMDEFRQGIAKLQGINQDALKQAAQNGDIRTLNRLADQTIPALKQESVDLPQFKRIETPGDTATNAPAIKQIEDAVTKQSVKPIELSDTDLSALKDEAKKLKQSFRGKANWVKDSNNKYAKSFVSALDELANNPNADTYTKARKALSDYIDNSSTKNMKSNSGAGGWYVKRFDNYDPDTKVSPFTNAFEEFANKYGLTNTAPNMRQIEDAVQRQTAETQKVLKETEPIEEWTRNQLNVGDSAPRYREGTLEEAQGNAQWLKQLVNEEVAKYDNLSEAAQKNIGRVNDALDALDEAISRGASIDDIAPLNKEAERALGALHKNIPGDKNLRSWGSTYFGKNSESNVSNILKKGRIADDYPVDENGFMDVDAWNKMNPEEATELENMFDVMNEDTGIRNGFDIVDENAPDIRMDASTPDSMNANDQILPDVNVERLTREPNQLVDNTRERSFHASAAERGAIPDDIKEALRQQDSIDRNTYVQQKNWQTEDEAIRLWEQVNTFDEAEAQYKQLLSEMNPAATPFARRLVSAYSKNGQREAAMAVMDALAEAGTKSGRFSQAMILGLAKDDPMTALRYAERQINRINENGRKEFGKKWKDFTLTDEEKALFDKITPGDEDAIKAAMDKIGERIGVEYPTKLLSKVLEGRRLAMLFNLRTNIRNFGANIPTLGMRWTADRVEAIGQNIAHLINPDFEVTQAVTGSGLKGRKIAKEIFESKRVQDLLDSAGSKYEDNGIKNALTKNKTMFKGNFVEHWIDDVTGGGIEKIAKLLGKDIKVDGGIQALNKKAFGKTGTRSFLETFRNATYKMLDLGDSPFVKENFIERLGSYIHAQGIKDMKDVPDEAIQLAYEEAMKATYKDNSWGYQMVKKARDTFGAIPYVGKPLGEAVIPFVQAPGNIAARMVDYSPLRGTKGLADVIRGAMGSDEALVKRGIEEVSKGLTGTAAVYAGMKLYESGIITGSYPTDKDQREFEKQHGFREWSIRVPGKNGGKDKYVQFDWAQPAAEPLLYGALIQDAISKSDSYDSDILKALGMEGTVAGKIIGGAQAGTGAALNSWFNATPIQGLQDFMGGGEYASPYASAGSDGLKGMAKNIKDTAVNSFATSFVPAQMGAIAKSVDPIQRNTTDPTNSAKTLVNQFMSKIPGLSEKLPAKYDTWGREMKTADTQKEAFVARNLSPGELTTDTSTPLDNEISRLGAVSTSAFPPVAEKKAGDKKLNNEEMSAQQKNMGERNYELAEAFINSQSYKGMTDEDRVKTLSDLYSMSKAVANKELFGQEIKDSTNAQNAEVYNELGADGFIEYLGMKKSLPSKGKDAAAVDMLSKLPEDKQDQLLPFLVDTESSKEKSAMWEKSGHDGSNFINHYKKEKKVEEKKAEQKEVKKGVQAELASYGAEDSSTTVKFYNHAKQTIPSLTPKGYARKLQEIGGNDYKISQRELLAYATKKNLSQEEMTKYWNAFGEWSTKPYRKKDGTWGKK